MIKEENIKNKIIAPILHKVGWDDNKIDYEKQCTDGKIVISNNGYKRLEKKYIDILLSLQSNFPIAIIEVKNSEKSVSYGIQQALDYSKYYDVSFVYSTNGEAFYEHDLITGEEREIPLDEFPSPNELKDRLIKEKNIEKNKFDLMLTPYYFDTNKGKSPRYYQINAINRTVNAVINGQDRILLVMATGSGKTFTAFQIVYRLYKAGIKKKILYLADRNILIDQTMIGDFKPLSAKMVKVTNRKLSDSYEIYMALYQQLTKNGDDVNPNDDIFKQFNEDFFDLIIVDECHRGSVRDDSNWKRILDYFNKATKIGLTATPRNDREASNINYFGEPIYTYSLKQGIEDGFLAPYRVVRINFNVNNGWRPELGKTDTKGNLVEDREYGLKHFNKSISIEERDRQIAKYITDYLKKTGRYQKTIVFCIDREHAGRMRNFLCEENSDLCKIDSRYVMKITGDDKEGKAQLDNFININEKYPTIVTTSKLMTTGVDCKTCKLIVLESNIDSMTEFKQIIGRGTRIREDKGKTFFTIMDFRNATNKFADPEFDGENYEIIYEPEPPDNKETTDNNENNKNINNINSENTIEEEKEIYKPPLLETKEERYKPVVNGVEVHIVSDKVQYLAPDGKLITEDINKYIKDNMLKIYPTFNDFLEKWNSNIDKQIIINNLINNGILINYVNKDKYIDDFDLIANIVYNKQLLTRQNRAEKVKNSGYLNSYPDDLKDILERLLGYYIRNGSNDFKEITKTLKLIGVDNVSNTITKFGGKDKYLSIINDLEKEIYKME